MIAALVNVCVCGVMDAWMCVEMHVRVQMYVCVCVHYCTWGCIRITVCNFEEINQRDNQC